MSDYVTIESCLTEEITGWFNRYIFPLSLAFIATAETDTFPRIQFYESIILGIASGSYLAIDVGNTKLNVQPYNNIIRYLDWLLTTPFLALIIYEYAIGIDELQGESKAIKRDFEDWWFAILPAIMVITGYSALIVEDLEMKILLFLVSWLALLVLLYLIYLISIRIDLKGLQYFFYIGWVLYGLTALIPDYFTQSVCYNILDFFNKVVFSFYITLVVFS